MSDKPQMEATLAPSPETSPSHSASNTRVLGNTTVPTDDWLRLNQERDDLRAEVERLNQALDMVAEEREAWKAEVERLRDIAWKHGNRADEAEVEIERLRAENERLSADIQASLRERGSNGGSQ
jgi:chromosome segregation ATPase